MKKLIVFALAAILVVSLSAVFVSAAETNVAAGKSYTYTGQYTNPETGQISYPDNASNSKLTDGVKGAAGDITYNSQVWVGLNWKGEGADCADANWTASTVAINSIVVDLGQVTDGLTRFALNTQECGSGINAPKTVEVQISDDNSSFTKLGNATGTMTISKNDAGNPTFGIYEYSYTASEEKSARYVKFVITHGGAWTFVSEVEVFKGGETADPVSDDESEEPISDDESEEPTSDEASSEAPTDTSPAVSDTSKDESKAGDKDGLGTGAIAAIIAGVVVVVGGGAFLLKKKK